MSPQTAEHSTIQKINGVRNFLSNIGLKGDHDQDPYILKFAEGVTTPEDGCLEIQKDFGAFVQFMKREYDSSEKR